MNEIHNIRKDLIIRNMEINLETMIKESVDFPVVKDYYGKLIHHYNMLTESQRKEFTRAGEMIILYHDYFNLNYNENSK